MLLTRLAHALNAESALFIRASFVVKIFVWCDVITFLLQGAGGGLSSQPTSADLGHKVSSLKREELVWHDSKLTIRCSKCFQIALVGIAAQLVSYCLFSVLLIFFGLRV